MSETLVTWLKQLGENVEREKKTFLRVSGPICTIFVESANSLLQMLMFLFAKEIITWHMTGE